MSNFKNLAATAAACLVLVLSGCALRPTWHWERPGASDEEYLFDVNQCKAAVYKDASGIVTQESVRWMQTCMERKGWRKVEN
jgi:hypothetical protein